MLGLVKVGNFLVMISGISAASVLSKRDADAQFYQTNNGGVSNNYDLKNVGFGSRNYNQWSHAGALGVNYDLGHRETFNHAYSGYNGPVAGARPLVDTFNHAYSGYNGPVAGARPLVAYPNGAVVPVNEPAVALATADHLATKGVYADVVGPYASSSLYHGKRDADAQFYQTNNGGVSNNYDCKNGGCGSTDYNQQFLAGSQAVNFDLGHRETFNHAYSGHTGPFAGAHVVGPYASGAFHYGKRDADAQFYQTNNGGVSNNYDCKNGGCSRSEYYQQFHAGSQALNVDF